MDVSVIVGRGELLINDYVDVALSGKDARLKVRQHRKAVGISNADGFSVVSEHPLVGTPGVVVSIAHNDSPGEVVAAYEIFTRQL